MHRLNQDSPVTDVSSAGAHERARLIALSTHYLTWGVMRGIFTIANISTIVLLAYQIGTDTSWWMALFAIVMSILAYVSDKKQRRVEYQQVKQEERIATLHRVLHATSAERAHEQDDADRD